MLRSLTRSYNDQLQLVAQQIFETSDSYAKARNKDESKDKSKDAGHNNSRNKGIVTRSKLAVVAFGGVSRHVVNPAAEVKTPRPFVRGVKREPFGKESMLAVETSVKRLPNIETSSDILNHLNH